MYRAIEKLELLGDQLGYPHSSNVRGTSLRELRPRAGRSPWRAFYQRVGDRIVLAAIGPEALHDPRGFRRAIGTALARLDSINFE
ncbi:MAG: type II toxin-antitoxin system RelE/ParE family toxin [Chloroflexia bacterium]|nr:type II toxin-antitoxin system RelE/ParE family toxin [Chloroflexia bacterium]